MANSLMWDPATQSYKVTLVPPDKSGGSPGGVTTNINASPTNQQVTNRVYSSYSGPPANGQGAGSSWWEIPPPGSNFSNPAWNIQGPAFGDPIYELYITPTYQAADGSWQFYSGPPTQSGNTYTLYEPTGGGSTSIVISMIDPGGGGLKM
jgi:hypothetical protein